MHILSFKPEYILYFYMVNCVAVLVFNIMYIFIDRYKGKKIERRSLEMVGQIETQIVNLAMGGRVEEKHLDFLVRSMKKLEKMRAFEHSMEEVMTKEHDSVSPENVVRYLQSLRTVFIELAGWYEKRDKIEQAYFSSLIKKFEIDKGHSSYDGIMDFLDKMVIKEDVYVRENALKALYSIGNEEAVLTAWERMEDNKIYHNQKLLADGLLSFNGNREELARHLWARREEFDVMLVLPVMQFIRFFSGNFCGEFLEVMKKETEDKELRLEAIRYLRRYPDKRAREELQKFLFYQEYIDWEYAAMAASALTMYPGTDTVACLKEGLGAANWYVRLNCAEALIHGMKLPKWQLYDVYNGSDRYAREILDYVTEKSEIQMQEMELNKRNV